MALESTEEEQSRSKAPEANASVVPVEQEEEQKVVSGSVEHSEEEIASLISACYRAAGKKPVISALSKGDAIEALQSRSLEDLLALAEWAATDHYWGKIAFPGVDRPVSLLAKKQDLIAKRMTDALSKGKQPVQSKRAQHAPTQSAAAPPAASYRKVIPPFVADLDSEDSVVSAEHDWASDWGITM